MKICDKINWQHNIFGNFVKINWQHLFRKFWENSTGNTIFFGSFAKNQLATPFLKIFEKSAGNTILRRCFSKTNWQHTIFRECDFLYKFVEL